MTPPGVPPSMRPLSINSRHLLHSPPAAVAAKLEARIAAGYEVEGDKYPTSRRWSGVVVPAIAVGSLALPVAAVAGIVALFHVHVAFWIMVTALIVTGAAAVVAVAASIGPLHDPLRLSRADRRALNQARSWQSRQSWIGPRSTAAEYQLVMSAHETVKRLADSDTWATRIFDEHRLRLNLAQELDGIDQQAWHLATLRASRPDDPALTPAWLALGDRVALLRRYADGVSALDGRVAAAAQVEGSSVPITAGAALDQFATDQLQALTADLHQLNVTNFAPLPGSAR